MDLASNGPNWHTQNDKFVVSYLMIHSHHHYDTFTLNTEFNKEAFATYRKQILHTEVKIYTVL